MPFTFWGAVGAWDSNTNDVADWLPKNLAATQDLGEFYRIFGSDELLMISWDRCVLDDARIDSFRDRLLGPVDLPEGQVALFRDALAGPEILAFYQSPPLSMNRDDAIQKMKGWILSDDAQTTCLIAFVSRHGEANRHAAIDHVYNVADQIQGLSRDSIYVGGPTLEGVAIDRVSQQFLAALNLASFGVCLIILFVCLRNLRASILVFVTALFNEQLSMSLVHFFGENMDSVLLLAANLTFVLSISVGIHLVNYYREALVTRSDSMAPAWACFVALKPTALATVTTALGLASLQISEIRPISRFGFFASISVLLAALITIVFIGLHFSLWPLPRRPDVSSSRSRLHFRSWTSIVKTLRWPIVVAAFLGLILGFHGTTLLHTSVGLHELISRKNRVVQDFNWLEQHIGPLTPIEIVLETQPGDARDLLNQFRTASAVHDALSLLDDSYAVISTQTFAPDPPPRKGGFRQVAQAAVFRRKLTENQARLQSLGYLVVSSTHHVWRITIRCPSTESLDYGRILERVRQTVSDTLDSADAVKVERAIITGGIPIVYQTQEQMLADLINSFILAFGLVGCTLMLIFRSVLCGLICMIPNVLPCALAFGLMGYLDLSVELGTILTASAALGIAVDDSMHFITWFRRGVNQGGTVFDAVQFAFSRCAMAMLQTTFICSFGLLVFAASEFLPISKFGVSPARVKFRSMKKHAKSQLMEKPLNTTIRFHLMARPERSLQAVSPQKRPSFQAIFRP